MQRCVARRWVKEVRKEEYVMMGERVKTKLCRYTCSLYFLFLMHCTIDYAVKHCREHFHDALLKQKHTYVGPTLNLRVHKVGIHARKIRLEGI